MSLLASSNVWIAALLVVLLLVGLASLIAMRRNISDLKETGRRLSASGGGTSAH
jgi:hypothetical protein